jgi:hypothetical protein
MPRDLRAALVPLVSLGLLLSACSKDNGASARPAPDSTAPAASASVSVSAASTPPWQAAPGSLGSRPAPPVAKPRDAAADRKWCLEVTKAHYVVAADHPGPIHPSFEHAPELDCREGFAWRASRRILPAAGHEPWDGGFVEAEILHREDDGSTKVVHTLRLVVAFGAWDTEVLTGFTVGDVDGDGRPEVLWSVYKMSEGKRPRTTTLMTLVGIGSTRALAPFPLPPGVVAAAIVDADRDGRFDVASNGPYEGIQRGVELAGSDDWFDGQLLLYRSLGGGRFDATSEASQRWLARGCALKETSAPAGPAPAPGAPDWRSGHAIVCARARGQSEAAVRGAIRAQCPKLERRAMYEEACAQELLDIAAIEPPTKLPAGAP